jgi:hypothetical protein
VSYRTYLSCGDARCLSGRGLNRTGCRWGWVGVPAALSSPTATQRFSELIVRVCGKEKSNDSELRRRPSRALHFEAATRLPLPRNFITHQNTTTASLPPVQRTVVFDVPSLKCEMAGSHRTSYCSPVTGE